MDAEQLRALQKPLKDKYRENPASALWTLHARGRLGPDASCRIVTGSSRTEAGLHPATGGDGSWTCSGDMLLEALAACAGVTMNAVATAMGMKINGEVRAEGDLDFRGTLGVSKEAPVGFKSIRLHFELESNASEEQLQTLLKLTERYCVVFQTLQQKPDFDVTIHNSA